MPPRLKERYREGMSLTAALGAALAALAGQGNGDTSGVNAGQLEVAVLMRGREHRAFRRLTGPRLEELVASATGRDGAPAEPPKPATGPEPGEPGTP